MRLYYLKFHKKNKRAKLKINKTYIFVYDLCWLWANVNIRRKESAALWQKQKKVTVLFAQ